MPARRSDAAASPPRPTHAAFLRAVNVGGRTVKMDRLRAAVEALGASSVSTHIASGNVRFTPGAGLAADLGGADLEAVLSDALAAEFGFTIDVFVRTMAELRTLVRRRPFPGAAGDDWTLHVGFLHRPCRADERAALAALASPDDLLKVTGRDLAWLRKGRFSDSTITGPVLERALGQPTTLRRIDTVVAVLDGGR